jgi:tetratricopeptide (TPR) repeat protein
VGDLNGAADVYYHLALWCENQNQKHEASQYIKKTLELNPDHAAALEMTPKDTPQKNNRPEEIVLTYQVLTDEPAVAPKEALSAEMVVRGIEVSPEEAFNAQMGIADQYAHQGLLIEAISIYQQLFDLDPGNSEVIAKINRVYGAYAKTGIDLTGVLATAPPVDEETQKTKVAVGKKVISEIGMKAAKEAAIKISLLLEKNSRDAAKKNNLDRSRLILKELAVQAFELANKKMRGEIIGLPQTDKSVPVISADSQDSKIAGKTSRSTRSIPADTIFLKVGEPSVSTNWTTEARRNVRDKMKKIGFV